MAKKQVRVLLHLAGPGSFTSVSCKLADYREQREQLHQAGVRIERATLFLAGGGVRHLARPSPPKAEPGGVAGRRPA